MKRKKKVALAQHLERVYAALRNTESVLTDHGSEVCRWCGSRRALPHNDRDVVACPLAGVRDAVKRLNAARESVWPTVEGGA